MPVEMRRRKTRRLTNKQKKLAENGLKFVKPAVASFIKKNPDLRNAVRRVDMVSVAMQAVASAALTYDESKSLPQTYFGSAIRHALFREVLTQVRQDGRFVVVEQIIDQTPSASRTRANSRALQAIRMLSPYDRTLLEDRLVEGVTLEQLGYEQGVDPRTIKRRIQVAVERLRRAESQLP